MMRTYFRAFGQRLILLAVPLSVALISCGTEGEGTEGGLESELVETPAAIVISSDVPSDIPGGASDADLRTAALFAWQEFIALNWPAVDQNGGMNTRDVPDNSLLFGGTSSGRPLVWETYRHKAETFPAQGNLPPGYVDSASLDYGYDHLPEYNYRTDIPPCSGETSSGTPWVNLDEVSQISLDDMFAGVLKDLEPTPRNSSPQLIRFLAKANRTQYRYIAEKNYWNFGGNYYDAVTTFTNAVADSPRVVPPSSSIVSFPAGTIEVKAAWRLLGPNDDKSRFHTAPVRYYENADSTGSSLTPKPCYCDDKENVWGLIALHIIQKTPTAPYFTFATFEQADNIVTTDGKPVEDENGAIINPPSDSVPTSPGVTYNDPLAPNPTTPPALGVTADGAFLTAGEVGNRLYYRNTADGLPRQAGGSIGVNGRYNPIPSDVIEVNKEAHAAIAAYNKKNNITGSPWGYYKLVNIQWRPFNNTDVDASNPNGPNNPSTYNQANIVVETNNTLQAFSGQQIGPAPAPFTAVSTKYSGVKSHYDFLNKPFHNVYVPHAVADTVADSGKSKSFYKPFTMGGCMGCHGNAQAAGADFSFILFFGPVQYPEFPESEDVDGRQRALMRQRYRFSAAH